MVNLFATTRIAPSLTRTVIQTTRPKTPPSSLNLNSRSISSTSPRTADFGWSGRQADEHLNDRQGKQDELDVQSNSSGTAKRQKADGKEGGSAVSEDDPGNNNERAQKDHPEAPGPVIGMNDERGGAGHGKAGGQDK
ncbi:MAG: hypothetical protein M1827_004077 [Pycnora praestabilis]|nr:MAG: hypothetical protein M1827_004077 [Pycnora praestabilis]